MTGRCGVKRGLGRNWRGDPRWWYPQGQARGTLLGALTRGWIRCQWVTPEEQQPLHDPPVLRPRPPT